MDGITLEELRVVIEAQTSQFKKEIASVQSQLKSMTSNVNKETNKMKSAFSGIGKAAIAALAITAVLAVAKFGASCIELGSALTEVQNVVDVTFGSMSGAVNNFADTAITQFGLSEKSAKQYSSTMGAMLKSMQIPTGQALEMSTTLAGLSGDMASFYNLSGDNAFDKIRAGITGETEPLKQLGINMSVANLEAYAMSQGITKAYSAMNQQEQTMLRYNYLLSVTSDAQGDFARTSNSWANQTRILSEQFNSLKATTGQGLINVLTPVITLLNSLMSKLQGAASAFEAFTALITGKQASSSASGSIASAITATDSLADSTASVGTAAAATAAQVKKSLAGFDQINQLSDNSSSSGGGTTGSSGSSGTSTPTVDSSDAKTTSTILDGIADKLAPLQTALENLKTAFAPFKDNVGEGLKWFYDDVLVPVSTMVITETVPAFLGDISGAITVLNTVAEKFKTSGAAKTIGDLISSMTINQTNNATEWFKSISDALDSLNTFIDKPNIKNFGTLIDDIATAFNKSPVMWTPFKVDFGKLFEGLKTDAETLLIFPFQKWWEVTAKDIGGIKAYWATKWDDLKGGWKALTDHIEDKTANFKAEVKTLPSKIKGDWYALSDNVQDKTADFRAKVATTLDYIQTRWDALKGAWKGWTADFKISLSTKVGEVKNFVNKIIDAINDHVISKLSFSFQLPKVLGGAKWAWSAPEIQQLARGGIVDGATPFIAGEAGKEAVIPLENNTGWMDSVADRIASRIGMGNGITRQDLKEVLRETTSDTVLYVGSEELARATNRGIASLNRRTNVVLV